MKHQIFVKTIYLFQNTTCRRLFLKVVCPFIWREEYRPAIYFFNVTGFFWRISLSHPFFHGGWYFLTGSCSSCSYLFFCIYFDMRTCVHPLFESFFQQHYVSFQKRLVLAMHSFKCTIIIYREYLQPSILSTVLHIFNCNSFPQGSTQNQKCVKLSKT